jgi:thermitase
VQEKNVLDKTWGFAKNLVGIKTADIKTNQESVNNVLDKFEAKKFEKLFDTESKKTDNKKLLKIKNEMERFFIIDIEDRENTEEIVSEMEKNPFVESVDFYNIYYTFYTPNDPSYNQQWAHQNTQAELGWDIETGEEEIVIAVVDTGVDYNHEDLAGNMLGYCSDGCPLGTGYDFVSIDVPYWEYHGFQVVEGEDYTEIDDKPMDVHGHGSHCAGIAAAVTNNNKGVAGVCPNCKIMPVRAGFVFLYHPSEGDPYLTGSLDVKAITSSIRYAADNGADIITMSFGGSSPADSITSAIRYAHESGVILIAAAGNDDSNDVGYPAGYKQVIAIAASDENDERCHFSNSGEDVDFAAPGINILSTIPNGYRSHGGTSMATPYVAGVAGLLLSRNPNLNFKEVRRILREGVDPINNPQSWRPMGTGRINIRKSLLPESKLMNSENEDITGDFKMVLQKKDSFGDWEDYEEVINTPGLVLRAGEKIDLSQLWNNQNIGVSNQLDSGDYRVYTSFQFREKIIENSWEFEVL